MQPEETRAIRLIMDAGLNPKSQIAQKLKPLIMEALREKYVCPACELERASKALQNTPPNNTAA